MQPQTGRAPTPEDYLRVVDFWLRDLPWSARRDLLAELRDHLDELPADTDLRERLGPPEEYAADLRAAAGLEHRRGLIAFLRARRPRNLILTVVALMIIGLAIGAVAWIDSYQPLAFQSGAEIFPPAAVQAPGGFTGESVVFHKGGVFRLGLDIQNTGRFTVRVVGVSYGPGRQLFSDRLLASGPGPASGVGFPGVLRPFHPFDMKPGERRELELKGVYAHCRYWRGGGSRLITDFPVRYRFLWRTATADIPLPEPLAIVFPMGFRCDAKP
ncbi:MAG TPA: hypothetical protein VJ716_04435 [Gaiellaceae bacterium]|nr:hypothetical protein [Gaiellaceae bacterium]